MTSFSLIDLQTEDLDWFGVDSIGEVGHFTSAGTVLLPARVIQSRENLDEAYQCFERLPRFSKALLAPEVEVWWKGWATDGIRKGHWEAFSEWAERGLYTFDCLIWDRKGPYYMVAFPESPLLEASLPPKVAKYLGEFRFPFRFRDLFTQGLNVEGESLSLVDSRSL